MTLIARCFRRRPGRIPVWSYFRNSLIVSITSTFIALGIGMAGGYAFARYKFKGKSAIFLGFMLTRAVPGIALSLPLFMIFARTGIIDTHFALILTYVALNVPFTIWLIDGFFRQVPKDLAEAAQIDGLHPLAGVLAGGISAGRSRHRIRWYLRLSHLLERICAGLADHPLGELQGRCRSACSTIPPRFTIDWRGMCALAVVMIIPALTLILHHTKTPRLRPHLRRGQRINHGSCQSEETGQALRRTGSGARHRPRSEGP